jgi:hypothetical protein
LTHFDPQSTTTIPAETPESRRIRPADPTSAKIARTPGADHAGAADYAENPARGEAKVERWKEIGNAGLEAYPELAQKKVARRRPLGLLPNPISQGQQATYQKMPRVGEIGRSRRFFTQSSHCGRAAMADLTAPPFLGLSGSRYNPGAKDVDQPGARATGRSRRSRSGLVNHFLPGGITTRPAGRLMYNKHCPGVGQLSAMACGDVCRPSSRILIFTMHFR